MSPPAHGWKPPARRSPKPTSACSGSRPKRAPSRNSSTARPRTCGRRSSTASPSPRVMKRRSAPRSATISMRRSIPPRRCAGPMPGVTEAIRRCPTASKPLAAHVEAPSELARRLAQIGVVAKERGAELVSQLKTGQRLVSLEGDVWRWDGFVAAAHAPTGAARRLAERARLVDIENELEQARIDATAKRQALETAESRAEGRLGRRGRRARSLARRAARGRCRARAPCRHRARDQPPRRAQIGADRSAHAASPPTAPRPRPRMRAPPRRSPNCRRASTPKTKLAAVRTDIDGHRRFAAQVRAEAQALAREAELADRRVQAILAERNEWQNRKQSAASQIATIEARVTEVTAERAELDNAPALFAEKRRALINEIEAAESARRVAADALAAAENVMAETDRAAKISLEALSSAREACARAEERMDGAQAPPRRHRARNPRHAGSRAARRRRPGRDRAGRRTAAARRDRGKPRKAAPRPRAARRRQSARRGRTARGRGPAHRADHRARRPGRSHQAAAPGHPEPQPRSARAAADLVRDRQRATSSGCSPNCSAAARPRCT